MIIIKSQMRLYVVHIGILTNGMPRYQHKYMHMNKYVCVCVTSGRNFENVNLNEK